MPRGVGHASRTRCRTRSVNAPEPIVAEVRREAESELAGYRGRLSPPAWQHAVTANSDRLLRERYGLPV